MTEIRLRLTLPRLIRPLRTSVEEANMKDGKVDIDSVEAIAFDPYTHGYYKVSGRVGDAFKDGLKLKQAAAKNQDTD